jgi:hypothetical protein
MTKNVDSKEFKELLKSYMQDNLESGSSESGIEYTEKPKKERKPYVLTEKRKEQFEKARLKRQENIAKKKLDQQKENENYLMLKANLEKKKKEKEIKKQQKDIAKLALEANVTDEEQVIIKKKPKKKVIVVESDSDDDIIYKRRPKEPIQTPPQPPPRPVRQIRYL